jgi:tetratricopeptide (TPR) repeat protein
MIRNRFIQIASLSLVAISCIDLSAANAESSCASAYKLYQQGAFAQAADMFEDCIKKSRPEANLYYYAALANRRARREPRALQLFAYVLKNFPGTPQAAYAGQVFATSAPAPTAVSPAAPPAAEVDLPDAVKAQLSPEMRALLKTSVGQEAIKAALQQHDQAVSNPPIAVKKKNEWEQFAAYVDVRDHTGYSDAAKNAVAEAISLIPEGPRSRVLTGGCRVILIPTSKDFDGDPGFDPGGMFLGKKNVIEISEKDGLYVKREYKCILFHEWGHAFDNGTSKTEAYCTLFNQEVDKLSATDLRVLDYYVNLKHGTTESFAQLFAIACADEAKIEDESPSDGELLREKFPKTLAYVRSLMGLP